MKKWFLEKWSVGYACHSEQSENNSRIPVVEEAVFKEVLDAVRELSNGSQPFYKVFEILDKYKDIK